MNNRGLMYETMIKNILIQRKLLSSALTVKLSRTENDAGFIHNGQEYFLELKNASAPDYGARQIDFNPMNNSWQWNGNDAMTKVFNQIGILQKIKSFTPRKFIVEDKNLTEADKRFDRSNFANKIPETDMNLVSMGTSGAKILHEYYAKKDCFYIQIEGKGFYYLQSDPANLGVPQFVPQVTFRLRAKTHGSARISNYSFRVVITAARSTFIGSDFDLEDPQRFPL